MVASVYNYLDQGLAASTKRPMMLHPDASTHVNRLARLVRLAMTPHTRFGQPYCIVVELNGIKRRNLGRPGAHPAGAPQCTYTVPCPASSRAHAHIW